MATPPDQLEVILSYRLGSDAEAFQSWDILHDPRISREQAYLNLAKQAERLQQSLPPQPPNPNATPAFLNDCLTGKIHHFRPDLMDAFMLGRAAARLVVLAKVADKDSPEWQGLWKETKEAVLFGASKMQVPQDQAGSWIDNVRTDPERYWRHLEALLT